VINSFVNTIAAESRGSETAAGCADGQYLRVRVMNICALKEAVAPGSFWGHSVLFCSVPLGRGSAYNGPMPFFINRPIVLAQGAEEFG